MRTRIILEEHPRRIAFVKKIQRGFKWETDSILSVDYQLPEHMAIAERPSVIEKLAKKVKKAWDIDLSRAYNLDVNLN